VNIKRYESNEIFKRNSTTKKYEEESFMKGKFYNPETGKWISGGAAQQMIIKKNGGWDEHHRSIVEKVTVKVTNEILDELEINFRRSNIRAVK
jgi:hypothetical protein